MDFKIISTVSALILPVLIVFIWGYGLHRKIDVFSEFQKGATENLKTAVEILPALLILITSINMLKESGALEALTAFVSPLATKLGFPPDCVGLALIRPISGSGAISYFKQLLTSHSPDSFTGKVASVMMGSTETTFYVITVYFSALKQKCPRKLIVASLIADFTGFVMSVLWVNLLMQN